MSNTHRFSVSLNAENGEALRALVEKGIYPSISSAVDAAVGDFLELEQQRKAWWEEMLRRCDEAEAHPERLLDPEEFHRSVQARIDGYKASHGK